MFVSIIIVNPCSSNPCNNGGVCSSDAGAFECDCSLATGWNGDLCQVNINECTADSPNNHRCQNGGVCQDTDGSYTCDCSATGYTGDRCQTGSIERGVVILFYLPSKEDVSNNNLIHVIIVNLII